jgi:solute carrier family 25 (peroxisomal adenine nucleotide transporter), member 17
MLHLQIFLIGALAKLGATVVTYPLLLIKSRLMSQSKTDAAEHRYSGTVDALVRIYTKDGAPLQIKSSQFAGTSSSKVS